MAGWGRDRGRIVRRGAPPGYRGRGARDGDVHECRAGPRDRGGHPLGPARRQRARPRCRRARPHHRELHRAQTRPVHRRRSRLLRRHRLRRSRRPGLATQFGIAGGAAHTRCGIDCGLATAAARRAAEAALRVGAGLVSLATHPDHAAVTTSVVPEIMCHAVGDAHTLRPLLTRANVVAIGPGLGQSQWGKTLLDSLLDSGLPLMVDADALNLLARDPLVRTRWVLTPHPGEAARLLDCTASEVQADRFAALHALRARYGGVVVLKGAGSLILGDDEVVRVCDAGNPGMASGGMGDVLTGVIAGLAAQGMPLTQSAWLGVHLHARAGDSAALGGQRGLAASDLMPARAC